MVHTMFPCLPSKSSVVLAVLMACLPVWAETDVLKRPAPTLKSDRVASSLMTAMARTGNRVLAVGERGLIVASEDGGKTWQQMPVPVAVTLTGISFSDAKTAWVVGHGGTLLRSQDRGQSWVAVLDGRRAAEMVLKAASLPELDPRFRADAERLVADGPDKPLLNVQFFDAKRGLVVGAYGLIFGTTDGGASWQPLLHHIDNPKGVHLYGILEDAGEIWLSGEQGSLFVSRDGGKRFDAVTTPYQGTYFGMLAAGGNLIAYGMRGNAYWSADRGRTWQKSELPSGNSLTSGVVTKAGHVFLVDDGGNGHVSVDGGRHFQKAAMRKLPPLTAVIELGERQFIFAGARGLNQETLAAQAATGKQR